MLRERQAAHRPRRPRPARRVSLPASTGFIASYESRRLCADGCDDYDAMGCTPPRLTDACRAGCDIAFEEETSCFVECAADRFECSTFCFHALPGVIRFSGGCAADDACPDTHECVVEVCLPAP